jgi:hypothetical protein
VSTIRQEVLQAMRSIGEVGATYVDVRELLDRRHTAQQIKVALYRLSHDGYLRCIPGNMNGCGRTPGKFFFLPDRAPKKRLKQRRSRAKVVVRPISSPWNMVEGLDVAWPPRFDGGRVVCKLGPWTDD